MTKRHAYLAEMQADRAKKSKVYSDCKVRQVPVKKPKRK